MRDDLTLDQKLAYTAVIEAAWGGEIGFNYPDKIKLKNADTVDLVLRELLAKTQMLVYTDYTFRRFKVFYDTVHFKNFRDNLTEVDRQLGGFTLANLIKAIKRHEKYKIYVKRIVFAYKNKVQMTLLRR